MAFGREQEAYELTAPSHESSRAGSLPIAAADAANRRPSTRSHAVIDDANSDDPISDDQAKNKDKDGKDGKEKQAGMGDYFVRDAENQSLIGQTDTRARKSSLSVIASM